ncbi:MAG: PKD domain-containing protein, partial [Ferruginibacter sp.]
MKGILSLIVFAFIGTSLAAQYTVNGDAAIISCNEYRLTNAFNTQTGSVWNNNKIDLSQSFDFNFDIILSSPAPNDGGADGIAFVLQPISTSVGTSGSGLGYAGISPAVGVTIDTYQNGSPDNDPVYDHIAYQLNGDLNHNSVNNIAGPVTAINGNDNIEDGNWHSLHIIWDVATKTLTTYVDGTLRLTAVKDLVTDVFFGDPLVYWGFTGSTGALNNYQGFKTALTPSFHFSPTQSRCVNQPITFYDSTISFAPIIKFYWTFGDGPFIDSVNLNPVHTYTTGGNFTVTQRVIGADGCEATNTQNVFIGTKPVAAFGYNDYCVLNTIQFTDLSNVTAGTINNWYWDFDNTMTSVLQNPSTIYATGGDKNVKLAVKTIEGCESDTFYLVVHIYTRPVVDFTFTDSVCLGSRTDFFGIVISSTDPITNWRWFFPPSTSSTTQNSFRFFTTPGIHPVSFSASSSGSIEGCAGTIVKNVFVVNKPTAYFKNNTICQSVLTTLTDSSYTTDGVPVTGWWWDLGNGQFSTAQNPSTTYNTAGPKIIRHVAFNSKGCISDTLTQTINVSA